MRSSRAKMFSAAIGGCAVLAALLLNVLHPDQTLRPQAAGSGDSSTTNVYTPPSIPVMSFNPTGMSLGSTATAAAPATSIATAVASPAAKATAAAGCLANGQCP
jgi:hypothetical protein